MLRKNRIIYGGVFLVLFFLLLLTSCISNKDKNKANNPWSVLSGTLSSVAWSPNGDYIAFVTTFAEDYGDDSGSIWIMSVSKSNQPIKLKKLTDMSGKQDIPVALFWLDSNRVGWAASHYSLQGSPFTFKSIGLLDHKPQLLTDLSFSGIQARAAAGAYGGPDDVYFDAGSDVLFFSGGMEPDGVYVQVLPLSTKKARKLSVPGLTETSPVTLCGSLQNPQKPEFYVAAFAAGSSPEWRVWLSNSFSLDQDKVLITSKDQYLLFPRLSPNRKTLAYLSGSGETGLWEILLYDLESSKRRRMATISGQWEGIQPAHGCPYSWSPDGNSIAYADNCTDNSRIKIIQVDIR